MGMSNMSMPKFLLGTGACIFLNLFHNLIGVILSAVDDVLIESEMPMVNSSTSRI